ncbi:MAG: hypothetical protein A2X38_08330 [Elusimicrobia bacterium GWC2_61_25]|nr:MAG: hypothetical protein A2X38_08330 [Elusimicrobia bacterium GWC2_61_25]
MQVDVARFCCNFKVPYLISLHGSLNPWTLTQKTLKKKIYWNLFGKQTFRYASAIHYTCAEERRLTVPIIGKLRNVPGFVVPNGVNSQVNGLNIREKMGIGLDKFVLLYAGRIHRQKGLDFVIKAMSRQGLEKLVLLLVGYSDDLAYAGYLKRISAGIQNRIIWVNPVTAAGISDYYSSSNLFVLPSYGENFSMVAVEAMSFGLPVLITKNVGIWREVEQDKAGFIVEQNSEEISVLLGKVSQDRDLLRTISAHARACAETRYDINNVAALMAKAYEDIISGTQTKELQWE